MRRPLLTYLLRRLEATVLLVLGLGLGVFAASDQYTFLMNADFRWVSMAGAALLVLMGLSSALGGSKPSRSALLTFAVFLGIVAVGEPFAGSTASALLAEGSGVPAPERAGYVPFKIASIFRTLHEEAGDLTAERCVVSGSVYRSPELDAAGEIVVFEPLMACCLADAVAFGVRVKLRPGEAPPPAQTWVHVYGSLQQRATPAPIERVRLGAIMLSTISGRYVLVGQDVVTHQSLLADVTGLLPAEGCVAFRQALEGTGLAELLRAEGPFTVFAPIDEGFRARRPKDDESLRRYLEDFVVRGRFFKAELYEQSSLETLSGRTLSIETGVGGLRVEGARILFANQVGKNGVVHVIHPPWSPDGR